jgi:two-component system, LytTR family, response regulator
MEIIRAVIVDDEEHAIIDVREHLHSYENVKVVGTYSDGLDALEGINQQKPDLVFVDIEMPGLNGFEMLGRLDHVPIIIFCTGFGRYAIDGYEYDPSDFLLKPIKAQRFHTAMQRAFRDIEQRNLEDRLSKQKQQFGYLLLEFNDLHGESRKVNVWPDDIVYVRPQEKNANYLEYHMQDSTQYLVKKTLKQALTSLEPKGFIQVHRSFLINGSKIKEIYKNEKIILETPNTPDIPVSRRYRKQLLQWLNS